MTSSRQIESRGSSAQQTGGCSSDRVIFEFGQELLDSQATENPERGLFLLPGGYVADDGVVHGRAVMRSVTGFDEEWLADLPPTTFSACVVTGLLTRCLVRLGSICPVPGSVVRDMLVSDREYLIMRLREMTFGSRVDSVIRCSNESCGEPMEVSFSLADYSIESRPATQRFFKRSMLCGSTAGSESEVEFRLPTGADQEALARAFRKDETAAADQLLARCVRRIGEKTEIDHDEISRLPDDVRLQLSVEMGRLAPRLVDDFESACPECGAVCSRTLDFSAFFLEEIRSSLLHLERDIHLLAWHYHWSEREVLSLTRRKRRRYVEMVNQELDRAIGIS